MTQVTTAAPPTTGAWLGGTLALDLQALPAEVKDRLVRELTLYQRGYNGDGRPVTFALEHGGWFHVPRGYPLLGAGAWLLDGVTVSEGRSHGHQLPAGTRAQVTFGEAPYPPDQPKFIRDMVDAARANTHGGLCLAPTRSGKTLCSLEAACRLGGSTLILVDREPLLGQWKAAIEEHIRDDAGRPVPCGVIRGDQFDLPPRYPFVVGMLQTIVRRQLDEDARRAFRTVIVDECQSAPCDLVWSALSRVSSHHVFGLTATPDRGDGLGQAIHWIIGPEIAELHRELHADVHFLQMPFANAVIPKRKGSKNTREARLTRMGRVDTIEAEKALMRDPQRVARIATEVCQAIDAGRQVLVLVGLRDHAHVLADAFRGRALTPGVYIGGRSDPSEMKKNPVIATYGIAAKGIDFQPPPTLCVFAGPRSDVRQAAGRVLQPQAPHKPMILDIVDGAQPLIGQAHRRLRFYLERKFDVRNRVWS